MPEIIDLSTIEEYKLILKLISKGYEVPDIVYDTILDIAKHEIEDKEKVVIYKRDPDIHSRRMQGAYVKINEDNVIGINPTCKAGFGADFDGDCVISRIKCHWIKLDKVTGQVYEEEKIICQIGDILSRTNAFYIYSISYSGNKIISKFKVKPEFKIMTDSINLDTGVSEEKEIIEFSIHEDISMYKIEDSKTRFETFWASSDHSLIVYDSIDQKIKKISPLDLLSNPNNKFIIKQKDKSELSVLK